MIKQDLDISNDNTDEKTKDILKNIDQLLTMAEESEKTVSNNKRYEYIIFSSIVPCFLMSVLHLYLALININFQSRFENNVVLTIIFFAPILFAFFMLLEIGKKKKKEEVTYYASLGVVQELLPYYFDKMSVLEKTVYKVRLSKLDIAAIENSQEKISRARNMTNYL